MAQKVVIQLVEELKGVMPVGEVCRHLGVGCSSYYRWRKNAEQITQKEARDQQIGDLCKQHKFRCLCVVALPPKHESLLYRK